MSRLMLDSVNAEHIPFAYDGRRLELVAGYVDGPYAWSPDYWHRFPEHVRRVRIAIWNNRLADADVLDVEPGNNDASGAVPWIKGKWDRGETPTIYCFSDAGPKGYRISDVRQACDAAGVKRPLFWITDWRRSWEDFDPSGDPSIIALQYAGSAKTGGHFDASAAADFWPGIDKEDELTDEEYERRFLVMYAKYVKPHVLALKDAFNDHTHCTTGPKATMGNEDPAGTVP